MVQHHTRLLVCGSVLVLALLVLSGLHPYDRATWFLEVVPVIIALPLLWATQRRFPLTSLLYVFIFLHAMVLMLGGAYTYARVPLGFQIADALGLSRNPYDKIGHFFQGLVPALAAREILRRGAFVRGKKMLVFVVICIVLAISATYELIEWGAALALGQGADEFLGTQGDVWDTQSDMFCAFIGAIAALLCFTRLHERQISGMQIAPALTPPLKEVVMKTNPVGWFEIYVQDINRAKKFYETVMQLKLEKLETPDVEMWGFPMDPDRSGAAGALVKMAGVPSGGNSTLVYFKCEDCAVEAERALDAGGRSHKDKMSIGPYGHIALMLDTEGNMFGLHSMK